jgi:hypothetical protein
VLIFDLKIVYIAIYPIAIPFLVLHPLPALAFHPNLRVLKHLVTTPWHLINALLYLFLRYSFPLTLQSSLKLSDRVDAIKVLLYLVLDDVPDRFNGVEVWRVRWVKDCKNTTP